MPVFNPLLIVDMLNAGLMHIRLKPRICCAYIPPMLVPITKSGCSFSQSSFKKGRASAGSTGMSGAIIICSGKILLSVSTVPLAPDEPNPWKYMIFIVIICECLCDVFFFDIRKDYKTKKLPFSRKFLGGWWDSNPRHSEPQSDALTD